MKTNLIRSKKPIADHRDIFPPARMVEAMLDLVKDEAERIDARFLELACGSGYFLLSVLQHKLAAVEIEFANSIFYKRHYSLLSVICTHVIELLLDNVEECRANLFATFADYLKLAPEDAVASEFENANASKQIGFIGRSFIGEAFGAYAEVSQRAALSSNLKIWSSLDVMDPMSVSQPLHVFDGLFDTV